MYIKREILLKKLSEFVISGNGVIIGPPGVGKTYILKELCNQILDNNKLCFYLPIDKFTVTNDTELRSELGINENFITLLKKQNTDEDKTLGILIIDAFDSARSETSQKYFLNLIIRLIKELNGLWNIIVSVRTYDAGKSENLLDLFPTSENDLVTDNIYCRHLLIPKLSYEEVKITLSNFNLPVNFYNDISTDFKELLRIPFNLWLIEKLLSRNINISELSKISSEIQLLGLFFKQRVIDGMQGEGRIFLLTKIARKMVYDNRLSIRKEYVYEAANSEAWHSLLSSEILNEETTTTQLVKFSHTILFDYAISIFLIDDSPEKLVKFIEEDPSRPLFLRPSLNYYFTRLWHSNPDLFWKTLWYIFPLSSIYVRLFTRLLPMNVIVLEARNNDQFLPLLKVLEKGQLEANKVILRLLQSYNTLNIERDELWIDFFENIIEYLHRDFVWLFTTIISDIINREKNENDNPIFLSCGRIGRKLLTWVWREREANKEWIDNFGSNKVIPIVVKTFKTNPLESKFLLEKILNLLEEDNFPIQYVYQLTHYIDNIWPYDPDFTSSVYLKVFSYHEISEEQTQMGGIVLSLLSTRRQDYEMCRYHLIQHFPNFLKANSLKATEAIIKCLNLFIVARHIVEYLKENEKIEDMVIEFSFRGKITHYLPDACYIWGEIDYDDEPMKMAHNLFSYIKELAVAPEKHGMLDSILEVFADNVFVAYFWKKLLNTATNYPKVFSNRLYELCIAKPILMENETLQSIGEFIEAAIFEYTPEQISEIENKILSIPRETNSGYSEESSIHRRDRLLSRIPQKLLNTNEGIKIREEMEFNKTVPSNKPLVKFTSGSKPYTNEVWLEEQGVDLNNKNNKKIQQYFSLLDNFKNEWQNKIPELGAIKSMLITTKKVYLLIKSAKGTEKPVIDSAWSKLADCIAVMSKGVENFESEEFKFCVKVLLDCSKHENPIYNPDLFKDYNFPHWSPAPRNAAAEGLPWLAIRKSDKKMLEAIHNLAFDPVPSVRFLTAIEIWRLKFNHNAFFWEIVNKIAEKEENKVVLNGLCHSISYFEAGEINQVAQVIKILLSKIKSPEEDTEIANSIVSFLVGLSFVFENSYTIQTLNSYLVNPVKYSRSLNRSVFESFRFITIEKIEKPEVERAIKWLHLSIKASIIGIKELQVIPYNEWNDEEKSRFKNLYGIFDDIVSRTYFTAKSNKKGNQLIPEENGERLYFKLKPLLNEILEFALNKDNGLMFASTAHHFMEYLNCVLHYDPKGVLHLAAGIAKSSEPYNYNLDSLAIQEVVKLVEDVLADHRSIVREQEALEDLLTLLDIFADVGWPEAINLVLRLDEVFR